MKKILLTGFEPFAGEEINPSWEVVKVFNYKEINDYQIVTKQLPTVFYDAKDILVNYINDIKPVIVICFGQAGGSKTIRLERVAINLNDARIPDNKGNQPKDEIININGENAYFSSLPLRKLHDILNNENIPASISLSAGSYVCNHVFYHLMHIIKDSNTIGGFIHIPYLDIQVKNKKATFSLDFTTLNKAIEIILNTIIKESN